MIDGVLAVAAVHPMMVAQKWFMARNKSACRGTGLCFSKTSSRSIHDRKMHSILSFLLCLAVVCSVDGQIAKADRFPRK